LARRKRLHLGTGHPGARRSGKAGPGPLHGLKLKRPETTAGIPQVTLMLMYLHLADGGKSRNLSLLIEDQNGPGIGQTRFCREFYSWPISGLLSLCNPDWTSEGEHG